MTRGKEDKGLPTIQPAKTVEYETPKDFFDEQWEEVGGFDMDPFCRPHHYTARKIRKAGGTICVPDDGPVRDTNHIKVDGLARPWHGKVWMNPPYGLFLRKAVAKAVSEVECGNVELVRALLPAKTEVRWWQEYILREAHQPGPGTGWLFDGHPLCRSVRFLKGRLHFGRGDGGPARVGNVLVVWRK